MTYDEVFALIEESKKIAPELGDEYDKAVIHLKRGQENVKPYGINSLEIALHPENGRMLLNVIRNGKYVDPFVAKHFS